MTLHDPEPPRKHRRLWLWFPWTLFALLIVGWSAGWLWLRGETEQRMDAQATALRASGYTLDWKQRTICGYPFRLEVTLTGARVAEPSGWGLSAPLVKGEAAAYALEHWMIATPQGATLLRPIGGPVAISGTILRASIAEPYARPPRIAFEGTELTFTPVQGGQPFFLQSAQRLELYLKPGPDDQGAVFLKAEGARARLPGLLARIAEDRPVGFSWDMILSRMSGFSGPDWPAAARNWSAAGGTATVREASLVAGEAALDARTGAVTIGPDGRVRGRLDVDLRQASQALSAMSGGLMPPVAQASVRFENGQTLLGPLAIAPAPRVY